MDFCQLLHKAQENGKSGSSGVRYYSTKFEPPKKEKKSKELSHNIKKFLERKEQEERKKVQEAKKKKEELLALRAQDKKAVKRVSVMLKRTKSANQSVIQDAVDNNNTAFTLGGPSQPDEDDYGYVSQEASDFYNKMMEKYSQMPEEEPKFNVLKKKVSTNLSNTKERVRAALEKEKEEASQPHRRKRKKRESDGDKDGDCEEEREEGRHEREPQHPAASRQDMPPPPKPKPKVQAPPPMNFADLLKIAEKKQHEPILIEQKPKEEEKLLTKKQKKEMEREKEWRERRERGVAPSKPNVGARPVKPEDVKKIPKVPDGRPPSEAKSNIKYGTGEKKPTLNGSILNKALTAPNTSSPSSSKSMDATKTFKKPLDVPIRQKDDRARSEERMKMLASRETAQRQQKAAAVREQKPKQSPVAADPKPRQFPPADSKGRQPAPANSKPKQFPPPDLKPRPPGPPRDKRRGPPVVAKKRRILDDDEDEYDSELDDFIDDDEGGGDYSTYIKEIFGYDRARYRDADDDVDNMESTFAQQMREEVISTKIGIMEDLEDMKKEEEEKKKKALKKRKL